MLDEAMKRKRRLNARICLNHPDLFSPLQEERAQRFLKVQPVAREPVQSSTSQTPPQLTPSSLLTFVVLDWDGDVKTTLRSIGQLRASDNPCSDDPFLKDVSIDIVVVQPIKERQRHQPGHMTPAGT